MEQIRLGLSIIGALIFAVGLLWVGHGTGAIHLPFTGFMTETSVWTINGTLVAVFGLVVVVATRLLLSRRDTPAN